MIVVKKMKDDNWMNTWYFAEATKLNKRATGNTRMLALMNLKRVMKDILKEV